MCYCFLSHISNTDYMVNSLLFEYEPKLIRIFSKFLFSVNLLHIFCLNTFNYVGPKYEYFSYM